jgi:hypothetical protein
LCGVGLSVGWAGQELTSLLWVAIGRLWLGRAVVNQLSVGGWVENRRKT